jgi:acyl dehydratase
LSEGFDFFKVGDEVTFSKTVSESDVYGFAGITGDFSPNHVNQAYMARTAYGERIAHGALIVGYMSTASTYMLAKADREVVSYGYDRVRFVKAVLIGDTIDVRYVIASVLPKERRTLADVTVTNQRGEVVAVATHIGYFPVPFGAAAASERAAT